MPGAVQKYRATWQPSHCVYNVEVDLWALGVLVLACSGDHLYSTAMTGPMGRALITKLGKIPRTIASRARWSVPIGWLTDITASSQNYFPAVMT